MPPLGEHYRATVGSFLKTVVCFDNDFFSEEAGPRHIRKTAKKSDSGFDDELEVESAECGADAVPREDDFHPLNAHLLMNSFAKHEILCSAIKPTDTGDALVEQIISLAGTADVAVLDWQLERVEKNGAAFPSSESCRKAICQIAKQDYDNGGRLRLIVIYSGTDGPIAVAELAELLADCGFNRVGDSCELVGPHSRIVFFQKPESIMRSAPSVQYSDLPSEVVRKFSELTSGLLPTAALHGVTAIRDNTHHLLSLFDSDLDGAFLAHRALIPDPGDAEEFFLDILQEEIGALVRRNGFRACVDSERCCSWIDDKGIYTDDETKKKRLNKALSEYSRAKYQKLHKLLDGGGDYSNDKNLEIADKVLNVLYQGDATKVKRGSERLGWLTNLYGEAGGTAPQDSRMQLGVLVKDEEAARYLMCLQPLCDSVRVKPDTLFPFLILELVTPDNKKFRDLYIPRTEGAGIWLQVDPSPQKLVSFAFDPKHRDKAAYVEAEKRGDDQVFYSRDRRCLSWVGEVKLGKAQRFASQLAARLHTLGIEEFEWMRLQQRQGH